jgi:hypothetical protein
MGYALWHRDKATLAAALLSSLLDKPRFLHYPTGKVIVQMFREA